MNLVYKDQILKPKILKMFVIKYFHYTFVGDLWSYKWLKCNFFDGEMILSQHSITEKPWIMLHILCF